MSINTMSGACAAILRASPLAFPITNTSQSSLAFNASTIPIARSRSSSTTTTVSFEFITPQWPRFSASHNAVLRHRREITGEKSTKAINLHNYSAQSDKKKRRRSARASSMFQIGLDAPALVDRDGLNQIASSIAKNIVSPEWSSTPSLSVDTHIVPSAVMARPSTLSST